MDLELTAEQQELRSLASALLEQRVPRETPRAYLEGRGEAADLWAELAELGWYAVGLEDDDTFGAPGLCVLAEQLGRRLAPTVLVDVNVTARIVATAAEPVRTAWLERLRDGKAPVSLAVAEPEAQWSPHGVETVAVRDAAGGFRISGTKLGVKHGEAVSGYGVVASLDGEPAFVLVPADAPGVEVSPGHSVDPTGNDIRLVLDDVAVGPESIVADVNAADAIERAFAVGAVATAAEAVGAASASLDLAIDYAREREQFGRPIGAYQAVQHILADAHVLRETAWSAVLYASAALDEETPDAAEAATVAKAYVSRAARTVVESALQVFGGIGFTWEHDLHLFLRRVLACEQRFGDALFHERQLAAALASRAEDRLSASSGRRLR
jgi:alkylation response protein AidB-like acyl-CoA dehydrogenase